MPHDRQISARARAAGYLVAQRVALVLGAKLTSPGRSDEATWKNRRILLKSATRNIPQITATDATLARVDAVVVALEDGEGEYAIYEVSPEWFRLRKEPSRGAGADHVVMVRCGRIREEHKVLARLERI